MPQRTSTDVHRTGVKAGCPWWDRKELVEVLQKEGTKAGVMEKYGISRKSLNQWIDRHGIDSEEWE